MSKFIKFNMKGGGQMLVPLKQIGVVSTLWTRESEGAPLVMEEGKCLVRIKTLGESIAMAHSVEEVWAWLNGEEYGPTFNSLRLDMLEQLEMEVRERLDMINNGSITTPLERESNVALGQTLKVLDACRSGAINEGDKS